MDAAKPVSEQGADAIGFTLLVAQGDLQGARMLSDTYPSIWPLLRTLAALSWTLALKVAQFSSPSVKARPIVARNILRQLRGELGIWDS